MSSVRSLVGALLLALTLGTGAAAAPPPPDPASATLQLDGLVEAVLARNPTRAAARAALARARALIPADTALLPTQLSVSVAPLSLLPGGQSHGLGAGVALSQPLRPFGLRSAQHDAASARVDAAAELDQDAVLEIVLTTHRLHAAWWLVHRELDHNAELVERLDQLLASSESRASTGGAPADAAAQIRLRRAAATRERLALTGRQASLRAQLNALLHAAPDSALAPPPRELPLPAATASAPSPAVVAARAEVRAAEARHAAAQAQAGPALALMTEYSSMWEMPVHRWMVGAGIRMPLDGRGARAAIDAAAAEATARRHQADAAADADAAQRASTTAELERARATLTHLAEVETPLAAELYAATLARHETGAAPLDLVATAALELTRVQRETSAATAALAVALAAHARAHGTVPGGAP